jgi:GDP-4-dehydro-6-deoxy-D-mannose reductase
VRILVTGASGFAGVYLCRLLRSAGYEVVAAASQGVVDVRLDVSDATAVRETFREYRPRGVFHLAAIAYVPTAEKELALTDAVNRAGTANVLDAACDVGARTLVVSSGAVYGDVLDSELPATERTEPHPKGAYAQSKLAAEAECASRRARQEIIIARPFNHTGPGQAREYVCSDFAAQLAECEAGTRPARIEVGNLSIERDFSDVNDIVEGYRALFEHARAGETYNLCSGRPTAIAHILDILIRLSGIKIDVVTRDERLRSRDVNRAYGSYEKAERAVGWHPSRPLERTLGELLDDWRRRVNRSVPDA